jgi:hypothetical protein
VAERAELANQYHAVVRVPVEGHTASEQRGEVFHQPSRRPASVKEADGLRSKQISANNHNTQTTHTQKQNVSKARWECSEDWAQSCFERG